MSDTLGQHAFFIQEEHRQSSEPDIIHNHSLSPSPPSTPEVIPVHINPFSPPASPLSSGIDITSITAPVSPRSDAIRSARSSVRASTQDLPHSSSYYGSRPTTSSVPTRVSSNVRLRESFAAPPMRSVVLSSASNVILAPTVQSEKRMHSTLLEDLYIIEKP